MYHEVYFTFSYYRHDFKKNNHKLSSELSLPNQGESEERVDIKTTAITKEMNKHSSSFDNNEMPSNAINTNNSDKPSRIAGLVLSRRTGFVVAHQRGTLMDIEIT